MERQAAVEFRLDGPWKLAGRSVPAGWFRAASGGGHVRLVAPDGRIVDLGALPPMEPAGREATFTVRGVAIGLNFHWQRRQDQSFPGALELVPDAEGGLAVINRVPLEEYLACVIASEMRAEAPLEFLRAHAVISRSWLLAQLEAARREPVAGPATLPALAGRHPVLDRPAAAPGIRRLRRRPLPALPGLRGGVAAGGPAGGGRHPRPGPGRRPRRGGRALLEMLRRGEREPSGPPGATRIRPA